MTRITIRERSTTADSMSATLVVENMGEYPVTVTPPFSEAQEEQLEWYFEQHLRQPFTNWDRCPRNSTSGTWRASTS